jgi:hypothetical protein
MTWASVTVSGRAYRINLDTVRYTEQLDPQSLVIVFDETHQLKIDDPHAWREFLDLLDSDDD